MPIDSTGEFTGRRKGLFTTQRLQVGLPVDRGTLSRLCILLMFASAFAQQFPDWQQQIREQVKSRQLDAALATIENRLAASPSDLEAHGWRGRLLAWKGRWPEAEAEYRQVLERSPDDIDILIGLADVLTWQNRREEGLRILNHARIVSPNDLEILLRRLRILTALGRSMEAHTQLRDILAIDPHNQEARNGLAGLAEEPRHELRVGTDIDTFNYTDAAQTGGITLRSRWTPRWTTTFAALFYQRFGEVAAKFTASATLRFAPRQWLTAGAAFADDHGVIPRREAFFEYGHSFRLGNPLVRGLEVSWEQRWLWYRGAHVLTLSGNQIYYLPRDWTWTLRLTAARSGFAGTGTHWAPSGLTRMGFPLYRGLSGNVFFALGAEDYARIEQIGRFSARTFGGGLCYRFSPRQELGGYVAPQDRSQGRSQTSFGFTYAFRF